MLPRRPALAGRYIKSATKDGKLSAFTHFDYGHVREKFRHWRGMAKPGLEEIELTQAETSDQQPSMASLVAPVSCETPEAEQAVSGGDLRLRKSMEPAEESYSLIQRLAKAKTRRREQLRYWAAYPFHPEVVSVETPAKKGPSVNLHPISTPAEKEGGGTENDAPKAESHGKQEA